MAWTDIADFTKNQPITRTILNNMLANLAFLRDRPRYFYQRDFGDADYTETSTAFVNVDATNMQTTLTTYGNDIRVRWSGVFDQTAVGNNVTFEVVIDSTPVSNDATNGVGGFEGTAIVDNITRQFFEVVIPNVSAGSHTITLQWRVTAGTVTWQTANVIQFEVMEI